MNSVGNIAGYLALVNELKPIKRQRILVREMLIALAIMFFFHYFGELLLLGLDLQPTTVRVSAGIILFLIALKMVFPKDSDKSLIIEKEEPFIVPLATPMIAGPSVLATIMLYAHDEESSIKVLMAILVAWGASLLIFAGANVLKRALGDKALVAAERLMGLLLTMMAMEMLLKGIRLYIDSL